MKPIILLLILAPVCLALTPKERELVNGLSKINTELRANNAEKDSQLDKAATDALFAAQKIESLSNRLVESKKLEGDQVFELGLQQQKIRGLEQDLDKAISDLATAKRDAVKWKLEAHRNAVERDLCLVAFAVAVTVLVMTCAGQIIGVIVKAFPAAAPYGALIEIGLAIGAFSATYGLARGALAVVASRL